MTTKINFLLDRSGSMKAIAKETIAGFNRFIAGQELALLEANLRLVLFNEGRHIVHNRTPINQVPRLTTETFVPAGGLRSNVQRSSPGEEQVILFGSGQGGTAKTRAPRAKPAAIKELTT